MGKVKANLGLKLEDDKVKPTELAMPPGEISALLVLEVTDKEGNITERRELPSDSFVKQFLQLLYIQCYGLDRYGAYAPNLPVKDTGGTNQVVDTHSGMFNSTATAGTITRGIVVGTDNTAPTISDYQLGAQIGHGTGSGQLQYGGMTYGAPSAGATISQFRLTRPFANGSGATVSVSEIGLYISDGSYNYLAIRDALASAIDIPDGQTLTVNYQLQGSI